MRNIPFLPLDVLAWLSSGTITTMTNAEEGIYARLIIHSWNYPDCTLPDDIQAIRKLAKNAPEKQVRTVLAQCFTKLENGWRNEKVYEVFLHAIDKSHKASKASKCRKIKETTRADAQRTLIGKQADAYQTETETYNTPPKPPRKTGERIVDQKIYLPHFTEFWDKIYPHREGIPKGKQETWLEFLNLEIDELPKFLQAAKNFRAAKILDPIGTPDAVRFLIKGRGKKKIRPWIEYVDMKIPEVSGQAQLVREELRSALENKNNAKMPSSLSQSAEEEFYKLKMRWIDAQQFVLEGKDVFNVNTN